MKKIVEFLVSGRVQGVMFRQTFIRAAIKRNLRAGATNLEERQDQVACYLEGEEVIIDQLLQQLQSTKPLNSWGAQVAKLEIKNLEIEFNNHQVTTDNVDEINWSSRVEMYI